MGNKHVDGDLAVGRNVIAGGSATIRGNAKVCHDLTVEGRLKVDSIHSCDKGVFLTKESLEACYPSPKKGWWAIVGDTLPGAIYIASGGAWVATGKTGGTPTLDSEHFSVELASVAALAEEALSTAGVAQAQSDKLRSDLESLTSSNLSEAIENFREVLSFLEGFRDDESLAPKIKALSDGITSLEAALSAHREDVGVVRFERQVYRVSEASDLLPGAVVWEQSTRLFKRKRDDGSWEIAPGYNVTDESGNTRPSTALIYRSGGSFYRVRVSADGGFGLESFVDKSEIRLISDNFQEAQSELERKIAGVATSMASRVAAHRREAGIYPFDGYCADVEMLDECFEGQIMWDRGRACFMECTDMDGGEWTNADENYCMQGHLSTIPRTDRLYRAGGALYRVRGSEDTGFELVRLVDEGELQPLSLDILENAKAIRTEQKRREANCDALSLRIEAKAADIGIYPFHGFESTSTLDDVADDYAEGAVVFVNGPGYFAMKTRTDEWVAAGSDYNSPDGGAKSDRIFRLGQNFYIVKNGALRRIVNADDLQSVQRLLGQMMNGVANDMASRVAAHRREAGIYPFDGAYTSREDVDEPSAGMIVWDSQSACFYEYAEGSWRYPKNEEYHTFPDHGSAIPLTDRLYRAGGALYRARGTEDTGFELVRLVDEGDARAVRTELRREIVGLWDETAKIQEKLADLYSTETANLLRRLGYEQEDIDEYRWAVSHLDIEISLEELRESVESWENHTYPIYVAPKWTAEMEAGELTPLEMRWERFYYAKYFPHITTGRGFWADYNSPEADYYAGLHATAPCRIDRVKTRKGLGSFTGQISGFELFNNNGHLLRCLKKLKSDIPISMVRALPNQCYIDLSNIDVTNATDLGTFSPLNGVDAFLYESALPKGLFATDKAVRMYNALGGRRFVRESFDFEGRASISYYVFCSLDKDTVKYQDWRASTVFDDCDINLSQDGKNFDWFGYFLVPAKKKSRIKAHNMRFLYPCALISPYLDWAEPGRPDRRYCGVWEVDCPDAEDIYPWCCSGETSATFWNLGSNLRTRTLLLREMMKSYQTSTTFYGFMADNEILRESFRASLRTWVSPPEACSIVLYKEQYDVLTEDDIATLTEKGYSIVIDNTPHTNPAQYKFN